MGNAAEKIKEQYNWIDGVEIRQYGPDKKDPKVVVAVFYEGEYKGSTIGWDEDYILEWYKKMINKKVWNNLINTTPLL